MISVENTEGAIVKNLDDLVEFASDGIVSKTFLDRPEVKEVLFAMSMGQELSEHTAGMPASIHVLKGKGIITLDKDESEVRPGTWIYMSKGQVHAVRATEDLVFLLTLFRKG